MKRVTCWPIWHAAERNSVVGSQSAEGSFVAAMSEVFWRALRWRPSAWTRPLAFPVLERTRGRIAAALLQAVAAEHPAESAGPAKLRFEATVSGPRSAAPVLHLVGAYLAHGLPRTLWPTTAAFLADSTDTFPAPVSSLTDFLATATFAYGRLCFPDLVPVPGLWEPKGVCGSYLVIDCLAPVPGPTIPRPKSAGICRSRFRNPSR